MPETVSTSGPPSWMQPYYTSFFNGAFNTANRPYQQYMGPRVAGMSSIQQNALGGINNAMYGNGATQAGNQFLQGLIGGNYAGGYPGTGNPYGIGNPGMPTGGFAPMGGPNQPGTYQTLPMQVSGGAMTMMPQGGMQGSGGIPGMSTNPFLGQMTDTITRDATNAFNNNIQGVLDAFSNPNSFGGSRHELATQNAIEGYGRGLGSALGNLHYGAFDNEMNRRLQATGMANSAATSQMGNLMAGLQAGNLPRSIQQQQYDTGYGDFQNWWNYPTQQTDNLARWLGMGNQFQQTTQQTPDPNRASQYLGGAMMAWPFLFGNGGLFG